MSELLSESEAEVRFPHILFGCLATVVSVLAFFLSGFAAQQLLGISINDPSIIVLQAGVQIVGLLLPALILARRSPLGRQGLLRLSGSLPSSRVFAATALIIVFTMVCETAVNELQLSLLPQSIVAWMSELSASHDNTMKALLHAEHWWSVPVQVVCLAIVPAVVEEIVFRGLMQRSLEAAIRPLWAIVWTTLVFSLLHFQPSTLLPMLVLGSVLGSLAYRTQSLVPGMVLHALFNGVMVALYQLGVADIGEITPSMPIWLSASLALVSGVGLIRTLKGIIR